MKSHWLFHPSLPLPKTKQAPIPAISRNENNFRIIQCDNIEDENEEDANGSAEWQTAATMVKALEPINERFASDAIFSHHLLSIR